MATKIMSILLTFFIFVIVSQAGANDVKSRENTTNRDPTIRKDENRIGLLKRTEPVEERAASQKKLKARFQSTISYSDPNPGTTTGSRTKLRFDLLRVQKQKKQFHLSESLQKVIYSFEFFEDPWRDRFLRSRETNSTNSLDSNFGQVSLNRYLNPEPEKYFDEGKTQSTLKLLQSKREEIFKEVFVGFRFSFGAENTHALPEMRISPSFERGAGFIIAF
ncbi:MAG TPA: hypothetical protein VEM15_15420 [Thermodesulfobacteriota bacterium]|nr:hypothetical protein [Thermodesulfobacteriota bacterium]